MDEEVGVHAAAEVPVAAPLGELGAVEGLVRGEAELGAEEHLPVDRLGIHVLAKLVVPPLPHRAVAVVAGLGLHDVADLPVADQVIGHLPARVGGRLDADGHHALVLLDRLGHATGLVDRVGHRLLAVDVLLRLAGVDGHLGVPVVGRGDDHGVDVVVLQDLAIVDLGLLAAGLGLGVLAVAVVDVGHGDDVDELPLLLHLEEVADVGLGAAAWAEDGEVDAVVGADHLADGRVGERPGRRDGAGGRARRLEESASGNGQLFSHRGPSPRWSGSRRGPSGASRPGPNGRDNAPSWRPRPPLATEIPPRSPRRVGVSIVGGKFRTTEPSDGCCRISSSSVHGGLPCPGSL